MRQGKGNQQSRSWNPLLWISVQSFLIGQGLFWLLFYILEGDRKYNALLGSIMLGLSVLLFIRPSWKYNYRLLLTISGILFFQMLIYPGIGEYPPHYFIEHSLQFGSLGLFAVVVFPTRIAHRRPGTQMLVARILCSLTFLGHGLFAVGLDRDFTNFIPMTTYLTGLDAKGAETFLTVFGILDLVAAVLVFAKNDFIKPALWYMIAWGLITAFARIFFFAGTDLAYPLDNGFLLGILQTAIRLVHGLVPLWLLLTWQKYNRKEAASGVPLAAS